MKSNKLRIFRDPVDKLSWFGTHPNGRTRLKDTYKLFLFEVDHSGSPYDTFKLKKELWQDWLSHNFAVMSNHIFKSVDLEFKDMVFYGGYFNDRSKTRIFLTSKNYNKLRRFRDKFKLHLTILQKGKFDYTNLNAKLISNYCYNIFTTEVSAISEVKKIGPDIELFPYHLEIHNFFQFARFGKIVEKFRTIVFTSPAVIDNFNHNFYFNSKTDLDNFLMLILLSSDTSMSYECIDHTQTPIGSVYNKSRSKTHTTTTGL